MISDQGEHGTVNLAICIGSEISWWKLWGETKESNLVTSIVVEWPDHHDFDQALKSPKITVKAAWKIWTSSESFSKFGKKLSNWELIRFGEQ